MSQSAQSNASAKPADLFEQQLKVACKRLMASEEGKMLQKQLTASMFDAAFRAMGAGVSEAETNALRGEYRAYLKMLATLTGEKPRRADQSAMAQEALNHGAS